MRTELLSDAKKAGSSAVNRIYSEVDARKGDAVTQVQAVSSTIEHAADSLDTNAPSWLRSALEQRVQQVKTFVETLEQNDSRQIAMQITEFAKCSPAVVLGACAAAGFAAARVFKAGSAGNGPSQFEPVSPVQSMPPMSSSSPSIVASMTPNNPNGELV